MTLPCRDLLQAIGLADDEFQFVLKQCAVETQAVFALPSLKETPVEFPLSVAGLEEDAVALLLGETLRLPLLRKELCQKRARVLESVVKVGGR